MEAGAPVVYVCLLFLVQPLQPARDVDVGHFLPSDGRLVQDDVHRVVDHAPQHVPDGERNGHY